MLLRWGGESEGGECDGDESCEVHFCGYFYLVKGVGIGWGIQSGRFRKRKSEIAM